MVLTQEVGSPNLGNCAYNFANGAVPVNGCANLSQNTATGYKLTATFPLFDSPATGDTGLTMRLTLQ